MAGFLCRRYVCLGFLIGLLFFSSSAFCDEGKDLKEEIKILKQRIERLEEHIAKREAKEAGNQQRDKKLGEPAKLLDGIRFSGGITFIIQGAHNANGGVLSSSYYDTADGAHSVDLEIERKFSDFSKAYIHLETGDGSGIDSNLKMFSAANRDADDSNNNVFVTEAWYEQYLGGDRFVFTLGKIDATSYIDTNDYANDECTQFLGSIFRNSPVIEFPDNSQGLHIGFSPLEGVDTDFVVVDGNSNGNKLFDNVFAAVQINLKTSFLKNRGNYRIIGWMNNRDHTKWLNPSLSRIVAPEVPDSTSNDRILSTYSSLLTMAINSFI